MLELIRRHPGCTVPELLDIAKTLAPRLGSEGAIRAELTAAWNHRPPLVGKGGKRECQITQKQAETVVLTEDGIQERNKAWRWSFDDGSGGGSVISRRPFGLTYDEVNESLADRFGRAPDRLEQGGKNV